MFRTVSVLYILIAVCVVSAHAQRLQDPVPPYPYQVEDVIFPTMNAGVRLAGTLTYPAAGGTFPAVVLVSGSGPQDRDEEIFGHRPFWVIADHLTRNGIAVLRYDDRGFGQSTGNFNTATTLDFADDASAAIDYLRTRSEINASQIGLIGHSEGGLVSPIVAEINPNLGYIISLAGTGISGREIILLQGILINRAEGLPEEDVQFFGQVRSDLIDIVMGEPNDALADRQMRDYINERLPEFSRREQLEILNAFRQFLSPWFRFFLSFDPRETWAQVSIPVLALNGTLDVQVPPENLVEIKNAVRSNGNTDIKAIELPGLNHLF